MGLSAASRANIALRRFMLVSMLDFSPLACIVITFEEWFSFVKEDVLSAHRPLLCAQWVEKWEMKI